MTVGVVRMSLRDLAPVVAVAGIVVLLLGTGLTRRLAPNLRLAIELFLAGGLLRLSGDPGFEVLAVAALVLLVRRLARSVLTSAT